MVFAEGSLLERIGNNCFCHSGIEEIMLPGTLKEIGTGTFYKCDNLKTIYVENGCEASLANACVFDSTSIVTLSTAFVGGVSI